MCQTQVSGYSGVNKADTVLPFMELTFVLVGEANRKQHSVMSGRDQCVEEK